MRTLSIAFRQPLHGVAQMILATFFLFGVPLSAYAQNSYRLDKAPFFKSFKKDKLDEETQIAHLPVVIDKETTAEFFYQGREKILQPLIHEMNRYLDSLAWSPVIKSESISAISKGTPYLFVGSAGSEIAPPGADMLQEEYDTYPPMIMHVQKPSKEWKAKMAELLAQTDTEYALAFWIGFNEYPKGKKGFFKKKVVLGTDYEPEIRFLSDELEPVEVLQLSALLIRKDGEIIKAGAEAFLYEDAPFWVQVLEASTSIDDKTIKRSVADIRRNDLPGQPLAWKVAMTHLLNHLSQHPGLILSLR